MASFQRFGTWEVSASHLGKEPFAKSWKKSFLPKKLKAGLVDLVKDRSDIFAVALPNETYICCPPSAHHPGELNPGEAGGYLSDFVFDRNSIALMKSDAMPRYAKWTMVIFPRNWKGSHSDLASDQNEAPSMQLRLKILLLPVREKLSSLRGSKADIDCICFDWYIYIYTVCTHGGSSCNIWPAFTFHILTHLDEILHGALLRTFRNW